MAHAFLAPRKLARHLFVLVVIAGCVVAGFWQLDRLHQVRAYNARVREQLAAPPQPIDRVIPRGGAEDPKAVAFRRISATGRYDTRAEVVLAGRQLGDNPGNNVLTPLVLPDGRDILVNRGWVRFGMDRPPVAGASPPAGTATVTGVLFPPDAVGRPSPTRLRLVTKVDLGRLSRQVPARLLPVYLWLQGQTPPQPGPFPRPMPLPGLSEGPHFSYAVQWFLFASVGLIGYPILLRREADRRSRRPARRPPQVPSAV